MEDEIAEYESSDALNKKKIKSYGSLILCLKYLREGNQSSALYQFEKVKKKRLSGDALDVYEEVAAELLEKKLSELYSSGNSALSSRNYQGAIYYFEEAAQIDEEYNSGQLLYNLAQSYRLNDDLEEALETYQKVVDLFPNSRVAGYSSTYISSIERQLDTEEGDED